MTRKSLGEFRKDAVIPEQRSPSLLPIFAPEMWVLSFDQSLASTGWSIVSTDEKGFPWVEKTGMIITSPTEKAGYEDTFARIAVIEDAMMEVIRDYQYRIVVHEMPATFGKRTDASFSAALTLRSVCRRLDVPCEGYYAQKVKKRVANKPNATKAEVKAAVKSLVPNSVKVKPANEHTFDSIAVALTHLRTN